MIMERDRAGVHMYAHADPVGTALEKVTVSAGLSGEKAL